VVLDLLDLLLDHLEHRHVVVDDEIEDRVEDVILAVREHLRGCLAAQPHRLVGHRGAVAHRDDVAAADEEMRLAEGDAAVDHLRRAGDDEQAVAVLLDLRPLMGVARILDGEVVQAELALNPPQELVGRLVQADPHDVAGLFGPRAGILDRNVDDAAAADIDAGRDDAGLVCGRRRDRRRFGGGDFGGDFCGGLGHGRLRRGDAPL
jgi:hypothetical protein